MRQPEPQLRRKTAASCTWRRPSCCSFCPRRLEIYLLTNLSRVRLQMLTMLKPRLPSSLVAAATVRQLLPTWQVMWHFLVGGMRNVERIWNIHFTDARGPATHTHSLTHPCTSTHTRERERESREREKVTLRVRTFLIWLHSPTNTLSLRLTSVVQNK